MSKLTIVRQALETNPKVVIVNVNEKNYLPDRIGFFSHTIDFSIAPKSGLYTADELQSFMMELVPNLTPTKKEDFRQQYDRLIFGKLYFDEIIGKERRITKRILTVTDEELLDDSEFVDGKQTIDTDKTEDYKRRIWVRPFPNEAFVKYVIDRGSSYDVDLNRLKKYQPNQRVGLLQRLFSRK